MSKPRMTHAAPMLGVPSVREAVDYYVECLGFEELFVAEDTDIADYGVVERDDVSVHFIGDPTRDTGKVAYGVNVHVTGVDEMYKTFRKSGAFHGDFPRDHDAIREHGPEDKAYGMRDMIFIDPFGYILVFGQPRH